MSGLTVEALRDAGALAALREDWNRLVDASARPNVFLTWEWLRAWWTHFGEGHTLNVLVVRDESRVVGIAPLCIEQRVLKFLGTRLVSSDYLDFLAEPGREREMASAVLRAIREDRSSWDVAQLSDLLDDSVGIRSLSEEARGHHCAVGIEKDQWCPYLVLAPTSEEYFQSLGRSKRSRLKRAKKAVEGVGCTYTLADRPDTLSQALEELFELHAKRWAARGLSGNLHAPAVRAFHHELATTLGTQGTMRIYRLEREGKAVACDYVFQRGKTVYFYQTAFDPDPAWEEYHPGYTLLAHCIEDQVERGAREFDFLRGREEYKDRWTDTARETQRLTVVPNEHVPALVRYRGEQAVRWAKCSVRALMNRGKR